MLCSGKWCSQAKSLSNPTESSTSKVDIKQSPKSTLLGSPITKKIFAIGIPKLAFWPTVHDRLRELVVKGRNRQHRGQLIRWLFLHVFSSQGKIRRLSSEWQDWLDLSWHTCKRESQIALMIGTFVPIGKQSLKCLFRAKVELVIAAYEVLTSSYK